MSAASDPDTSSPATGAVDDGSATAAGSAGGAKSARDAFLPEGAVPLPEEPATPMHRRRKNRAAAMQFLYSWDIARPADPAAALATFLAERRAEEGVTDEGYYSFAEELVDAALRNMDTIDEALKERLENWDFRRIAKVELALLRVATCELLYRPDIPPVVSINEAIELSKCFAAAESRRFINGLLDQIRAQLNRPARESVRM
ncbi:MAG: transcription antitermination factor NusB [Puniceicoccales bacterium]|jgi:N utilization substance protein B|nr:transcription antitermination factor NusB [Puniceicoccales bacterium]